MTATKFPTVPVTVSHAARYIGVTVQTVYRWLGDGTLDEVDVEGIRLVNHASVERLMKDRAQPRQTR